MLVIRLQRTGKRNQPFFRIVVAEKEAPIKGRFIEKLGFLNPTKKEKKIYKERVEYWISKGAQPSDTVHNILVEEQILKEPKRFVKIKKKKERKKEKSDEGDEGIKEKKELKETEGAKDKKAEEGEKKPEEKKEEKKEKITKKPKENSEENKKEK